MFDKITAVMMIGVGALLLAMGASPQVQTAVLRLLTDQITPGPINLDVAIFLVGLWTLYSGVQQARGR